MDNPVDRLSALASELEHVRRLKLDAYKEGMPPAMEALAKMILKLLGDMAARSGPLLRVCDLEHHIMKKLPAEAAMGFEVLFQDTIEVLKMRGDIVERDHGDAAIGITDAVLKAEKELFSWMASRDGRVEAALADAAKEAHPNWVKQERKVDEMLVNTTLWKITDPLSTPISPAALVDWFEKAHPAEAKRIRAEIEATA
jgi:hypothetical protein